jgi:hypothetical protein
MVVKPMMSTIRLSTLATFILLVTNIIWRASQSTAALHRTCRVRLS